MAIFGAASVRCGGANGSHGCQSSKLELSQDARSVARVKILKRSIGWFGIFLELSSGLEVSRSSG